MKVENMVSSNGNRVANQFIIKDGDNTYFQSYDSIIIKVTPRKILMDENKWDYSRTTGKYRNQFLGMDTNEIKKAIKNGIIELTNLN
jgi:hypothetical protein